MQKRNGRGHGRRSPAFCCGWLGAPHPSQQDRPAPGWSVGPTLHRWRRTIRRPAGDCRLASGCGNSERPALPSHTSTGMVALVPMRSIPPPSRPFCANCISATISVRIVCDADSSLRPAWPVPPMFRSGGYRVTRAIRCWTSTRPRSTPTPKGRARSCRPMGVPSLSVVVRTLFFRTGRYSFGDRPKLRLERKA